jgi:hypothetical protein
MFPGLQVSKNRTSTAIDHPLETTVSNAHPAAVLSQPTVIGDAPPGFVDFRASAHEFVPLGGDVVSHVVVPYHGVCGCCVLSQLPCLQLSAAQGWVLHQAEYFWTCSIVVDRIENARASIVQDVIIRTPCNNHIHFESTKLRAVCTLWYRIPFSGLEGTSR